METLFSCRNCVHNAGQSLTIGIGSGFCLKHDSVIADPGETTCKYLHRKDLPHFVVDEGIREHAAEFAGFSSLAHLVHKRPISRIPYSEQFVWRNNMFDPVVHSLAQYYKTGPAWVFVQAFSGGLDGRRSLAYSSLVRRYMDHCGTWVSSYRLVLAMLQEISVPPRFDANSLALGPGERLEDVEEEALWDVVFSRLAGVQEYGFHSGIQDLMWATDSLNGSLSSLNWIELQPELDAIRVKWTQEIIEHAESEGSFFPGPSFDRSAESLP